MKRNIAIVAGGDSSEIVISLKSAEGIFSFLDKDKYNVYIAIVKRDEWAVKLPGGEHTPIDKNDFSFRENGEVRHFDFAWSCFCLVMLRTAQPIPHLHAHDHRFSEFRLVICPAS